MGKEKINEKDHIKAEDSIEWLESKPSKKIYDKDYLRIVDFYVVHTPCKELSFTSYSLEENGWEKPWMNKSFRDFFDEKSELKINDNFVNCKARKNFSEAWKNQNIKEFFDIGEREFAVFAEAGEHNDRMDLLHRIRNSIAHGRFNVIKKNKEYYFFMEDVNNIKGLEGKYVIARMCLKKSTLLNWIDLFEQKGDLPDNLKKLYKNNVN